MKQRKASRHAASSAAPAWWLAHPLLGFALLSAALVFVLYGRALSAPFVYDDLGQIARNPALGSFHAVWTRYGLSPVVFTSKLHGAGGFTYRPLFWLSLALDAHLWGLESATGFHLTNLLLHWVDGVLLFVVLRRIGIALNTAAAAALLWLALPINTEAVAWVSSRAYLLSMLFVLAGLLAALRYRARGGWGWLAAYFAAAVAALLSHEEGLVLLPLTALVSYAAGRLSNDASKQAASNTAQRLWAALAGAACAAGLFYLAIRHWVGAHAGVAPAAASSPTLWSTGLFFWRYVQWMALPIRMSMERSTSTPAGHLSMPAIAAWVALLLAIGVVVMVWRRMPAVAFGLLWGVVMIAPFCVVPIYQGMAERFCYMASAGLALAVAALAFESPGAWRRIAVGALLVWAAWGGWRLWSRVLDWGDPARLYRSSLEATPASQTLWSDLGDVERERGELDPAIASYRRALALRANDPGTVLNLALTLEQKGDFAGAEQQFRQAIALAPKEASPWIDLGALYTQQGRIDDAIRCFQGAIEDDPANPDPYFDLGALFQQMGRDDLALPFYKKVLALKPDDLETLSNVSRLHPVR